MANDTVAYNNTCVTIGHLHTCDSFVGTRTNQDGHRKSESTGLRDLARDDQYSARKYLD